MRRVRTRTVRLTAKEAIELEPGIVLVAGRCYTSIKTRIGEEMRSGVSWGAPQFAIDFTRAKASETECW